MMETLFSLILFWKGCYFFLGLNCFDPQFFHWFQFICQLWSKHTVLFLFFYIFIHDNLINKDVNLDQGEREYMKQVILDATDNEVRLVGCYHHDHHCSKYFLKFSLLGEWYNNILQTKKLRIYFLHKHWWSSVNNSVCCHWSSNWE